MDISGFSDQYDVRRLTKDNLEEIYGLCRGNPLYYSYCPPFVTRESIKEDFSACRRGRNSAINISWAGMKGKDSLPLWI